MTPAQDMRVVASPTKDFFIHMLTRDIGLSRSILDLVDNCIDGALRIRGAETFEGLHVDVAVDQTRFRITDNCGGIPLDVARKYAFRFGRPPEAESTKNSIGQFGVGMKRALFKLGNAFQIKSTTAASSFSLSHNVSDWLAEPEPWSFAFTHVDTPDTPFDDALHGTTIEVTELHDYVADAFGLENFRTELAQEITEAHQTAIENGLSLSLNGSPLGYDPITLLSSQDLAPAFRETTFSFDNTAPVRVKVFAGLGGSDASEAGWYVFCNGRLVLGADKTERTGWGAEGETQVPIFHPRSARFRGYVYFTAEDAGLLPWNTTKTGVDADSAIYKSVRMQMIAMMRPVIDFLNRLQREAEAEPDQRPLLEAVNAAESRRLPLLPPRETFSASTPAPPRTPVPQTGVISYRKHIEEIRVVQRALGVSTQREVPRRRLTTTTDLSARNSRDGHRL